MRATIPSTAAARVALEHEPPGPEREAVIALGLAVTSSLQQAARVPPHDRDAVWASLERVLVAPSLPGGATLVPLLDPVDEPAPGRLPQLVRGIAERLEDEGALQLADSLLAGLQRAFLAGPWLVPRDRAWLEHGRVTAQRARIAWKTGDLDVAATWYRSVAALGRRHALVELRVRADIGTAALGQLRGNFPAVRRAARRAADLAERHDFSALAALAHHFLMVSAAVAKDWSAAVVHGWRAYQRAAGRQRQEAERLANLAQVLADTGRAEAAMVGFRASLARTSDPRIRLAALGGLVGAALWAEDHAAMRSAAAQLEHEAAAAPLPYQAASALAELAATYRAVGDAGRAARVHARALRLAEAHGYHQLRHALQEMGYLPPTDPKGASRVVLSREASEIESAVSRLADAGQLA